MFLIQASATCAAPTTRTSLVSLFRRNTRDYYKTFQWKKKQSSTCLADRTRSKWILTNLVSTNQQDEAVEMSLEEFIIHSLADRCIELGITPTITPGQSKHLDWVHDSSVNEQGLMRRALECSDLDAVVKLALGADQEAYDCFYIIAAILNATCILDIGSRMPFISDLMISHIPERCKGLVAALEGELKKRGEMVFDSTIAVLSMYGFAPFKQPGTSLHQAAMALMTTVASGELETSIVRANRGSAADPSAATGLQAAKQAVLDWVFKHQYFPNSLVTLLLLSGSAESSSDMRTSLAARLADMRMDETSRAPLQYLADITHSALMLFADFKCGTCIGAAEASLWLRLLVDTWMAHGNIYRDKFTGGMISRSDSQHIERFRFPSCLSALFDSHSSSPGTVDLGALVLVSLQLVAGVKNTELREKALAHMPEFLNDLSLGHFPYLNPSDLLQLMFSIMENNRPRSDGKDISYSSQYLQALVYVLSSSFFKPWLNSDATEGDRLRVADIISKCILSAPSKLENDPSLIISTPIMRDNVMHLAHKAYQLSGLTGALTPEAYSRVIADTARAGNIFYLKEYLFDYLHSITNQPQRSHDQRTSRSVHKSSFSLENGLLSITQNLSASILPELLHGCPSWQYHCDICSGLLSASMTSVSASWTLASLEAIDNICANDRTHNKLIITPSQVSSLAKSFLSGGNQKESSLDSEGQYDPTSIGYKAALLAFKIMLDEEDRQLKAAGEDVHHSSPYPILRTSLSGLTPTSRHLLSQALLYNRDSQFDHLRYLCLQLSPTQQTAVAWLTEYCERNADLSCRILNLAVSRVMSQLSAATPAEDSEDATVEGVATGVREVLIYIKQAAAIASAPKHDSKSAQSIANMRLVLLVAAQLCQALTTSDAYNGNSQRLVDSNTESSHQMLRTSWLHKLPEEAPYYQSLVFITQVCVQHGYTEPVKEVLRLCSSLLGKKLKVPREIALLSLSLVSEWAVSDEGDEGSELAGDVCLQILGVGSAFWEKDNSDYIHHMENILSEELNGVTASELLNVLMHVPSQLGSDSADCNWSSKSKARALLVTAEVMTSRITEFKTLASFKLCMNARISAAEHAKMYSSLTGGSKQQAMLPGSWQGGFQYVDDVSRKTKASQASNLADDLLSPEYHSSQAAQLLQIKVLLPYMKWENGLVEHVLLTPTVETYALFMAVHEAGHQPIMVVEMAHQILTAQLPLTNADTGQRLTCQDKAKSTKGGRQADVQTSCTEESFHAYWKVVETAVCIANRCCMHTASLILLLQFMRQFGRLRHGEAVSKALSSDVSEGTPLYTIHNRLIESIWEAVGEESFYELQELRESSSDDHSWILVKKPIQGSPWEEDIIELKTAARLIRQEF
ncbi:hypothetical protein CEUSTIGMA_g3734.t1 [Chlamydomonas eustigma]|uniref:Uncharacterized protein n=1 Tax=Chlamydomonas eustigma TaxID=1157962 RepID=A0A250X014_9CHLO|nr:hypothetical protein CEUSTIGMA_g3734.t1 [Chlamydomonas eustigma]|eukprot:GAX76289.1 hypothetical protein CEUSTIGMA_g3734.t1 [Chlamydomonas eustigma]